MTTICSAFAWYGWLIVAFCRVDILLVVMYVSCFKLFRSRNAHLSLIKRAIIVANSSSWVVALSLDRSLLVF